MSGSGVFVEPGWIQLSINVAWRDTAGARFGEAGFSLYSDEGTCTLDNLFVANKHQNRKFGRQYLKSLIELCRELGMRVMTMHANNVGRYAWARAGFEFDDTDTRDHVVALAKELAGKLGAPLPTGFDGFDFPSQIADLDEPKFTRAEIARAAGDPPPKNKPDELLTFGQALLLGPSGNEWFGTLKVQPVATLVRPHAE